MDKFLEEVIIGGQTLASLNFYLQVRPTEPNSHSFVAAWTTIPVIGGIGFEYNFDNTLTILSGPPPQAARRLVATADALNQGAIPRTRHVARMASWGQRPAASGSLPSAPIGRS